MVSPRWTRTVGVCSATSLFLELPATTQDSVLTDLENGALDFENVSGASFFGFLLQNTKEGYLADPIHGGNKNLESWKMIGFPGARRGFSRLGG